MIKGLETEEVQLGEVTISLTEMTMEQFDEFLEMLLGADVNSLDQLSDVLLSPEKLIKILKNRNYIKEFIEFVTRDKFGKGVLKGVEYKKLPFSHVTKLIQSFFLINGNNLTELKMLLANLILEAMKMLNLQKAGLMNSQKSKTDTQKD